jgi:hypothetical protein
VSVVLLRAIPDLLTATELYLTDVKSTFSPVQPNVAHAEQYVAQVVALAEPAALFATPHLRAY